MAFPQSISQPHIEAQPDCVLEHKSDYAVISLDLYSAEPDGTAPVIYSGWWRNAYDYALAKLQSSVNDDAEGIYLLARLDKQGDIAKKLTRGGWSRRHKSRPAQPAFAGVLDHEEVA